VWLLWVCACAPFLHVDEDLFSRPLSLRRNDAWHYAAHGATSLNSSSWARTPEWYQTHAQILHWLEYLIIAPAATSIGDRPARNAAFVEAVALCHVRAAACMKKSKEGS
jgi:hypothetical protein